MPTPEANMGPPPKPADRDPPSGNRPDYHELGAIYQLALGAYHRGRSPRELGNVINDGKISSSSNKVQRLPPS